MCLPIVWLLETRHELLKHWNEFLTPSLKGGNMFGQIREVKLIMKKIKILYTISNFHTAGSGKVVYDLVKHMDNIQFEVEIACGSREGDFYKVVSTLGL